MKKSIVILLLLIIISNNKLLAYGDITSKKDKTVKLSICLIADKNGGRLKAGGDGVLVVKLINLTNRGITIPAFLFTGKGQSLKSPSYINENVFYTGFKNATVSVSFYLEDKFVHSLKESKVVLPENIPIKPNDFTYLAIGFKCPQKNGKYKIAIRFDSSSLEEAFYSFNDFQLDDNNVIVKEQSSVKNIIIE